MGKNGAKFQRGTFNQTILKDSIIHEMRTAPGCNALKFRCNLLAENLSDMFSIEELSYTVYQRLYALLMQEYEQAFDKLSEREEKNRKGAAK